MQLLGIFSVVATATGCLYFEDQQEVASSRGLNVTAFLLSVLNLVFITVVVSLMAKKSTTRIKPYALWLKSCCFKHARLACKSCCWPFATCNRPWSRSKGGIALSRRGSTEALHSHTASDAG